MVVQEVAIKDIVFRKDLYPRREVDNKLIEKYQPIIEILPPIKISQNSILIDGRHRWFAHERAGKTTIKAEIIETESDAQIEILAYEMNSLHGKQLSNDEKRLFAVKRCDTLSIAEIARILSVSQRTVRDWTHSKRRELEEYRNELIFADYLRAWNTQEDISEKYRLPRQTVSDIIRKKAENGKIAESGEISNFKPFLYSIWNLAKGDETEHFGAFPKVYLENLLYYHTQPMSIVYDPFSGNGTTVDVCKAMCRRYYCSDRIVKPGREDDIRSWDIKNGLQPDLQLPDLAFIDPPYWKQAEGMYSSEKDCLGNMSLENFYLTLDRLLKELTNRKVKRIAIVIQPTQFKNDMIFEDHIFHFAQVLLGKYTIEMRYILPYSTEQYNAQMVEKGKENKICLGLHRDLVVFKHV
ncbi:MAG: ParB N-terminal domain-containing protein [Nitrospirae bacterium]|nr:ParB N-terminal domain-containing protein [Nitrospirota bacterium]MBF0554073.1 ParB N-terminal domain-containing protein [Nitrospirota bacterium]MBF0554079.1 ParB N-terminal domain-containing protein [Nitrospirota bacterium]